MDGGPDLKNSLKASYFVLSTGINLIILLSCLDWESSWLLLLSGQEGWAAPQTPPPGRQEKSGQAEEN